MKARWIAAQQFWSQAESKQLSQIKRAALASGPVVLPSAPGKNSDVPSLPQTGTREQEVRVS